jgi:hypothetical protein
MARKRRGGEMEKTSEGLASETPKRTKTIHPVRMELNEEHNALLNKAIKRLGVSRSAFFRMLLLEYARTHGLVGDEEMK